MPAQIVDIMLNAECYSRFISNRKKLDETCFLEDPEGIIRFRTSDPEFFKMFWRILGFQYPLYAYLFSGTMTYEKIAEAIDNELSEEESERVVVVDAITGKPFSLEDRKDCENKMLALHADPDPAIERKLNSILLSAEASDTVKASDNSSQNHLGFRARFPGDTFYVGADDENDILKRIQEESERLRKIKERVISETEKILRRRISNQEMETARQMEELDEKEKERMEALMRYAERKMLESVDNPLGPRRRD